jgi:hypothetical protein
MMAATGGNDASYNTDIAMNGMVPMSSSENGMIAPIASNIADLSTGMASDGMTTVDSMSNSENGMTATSGGNDSRNVNDGVSTNAMTSMSSSENDMMAPPNGSNSVAIVDNGMASDGMMSQNRQEATMKASNNDGSPNTNTMPVQQSQAQQNGSSGTNSPYPPTSSNTNMDNENENQGQMATTQNSQNLIQTPDEMQGNVASDGMMQERNEQTQTLRTLPSSTQNSSDGTSN